MKEGKLFYLLQQLSSEEFKGLKKAVLSPLLNTNQRLVYLYVALRPSYPNFENSDQYRRRLYKKVFPGEDYHHGKLHKLFTAFARLTEDYLLWEKIRGEGVQRQQLQLILYRERRMTPYFHAQARQLSKTLECTPYRDQEYYEAQVFLNDALYFNPFKDKYDLRDEALDRLTDSLDHYFALAKARYGISLRSRERILAKPGRWRFMKVLRDERSGSFMEDSLLLQLYDQAFLLLEESPEFSFSAFEQMLFENIGEFRYDAKVLFFTGLNYISRQLNRGGGNFSGKALEWYQFGLKEGMLTDLGQMTEVTFGNIVISACREEQFAWAHSFMEQYQSYLKPAMRTAVLTYNTGLWHFYKKEYDQAFTILLNYDFPTPFFLRSRLTAIRAIFEHFLLDTEYYELLLHHISAFEIALRRSKAFSKNTKESTANSIGIIKGLANKLARLESPIKIKTWFAKKVNQKQNIAAKQWLLAKVEEL